MEHFKAKMASILEKGLVKFHLRPKEFVSERRSKVPVSEESSNHGNPSEDSEHRSEHRSEEPRPPTILGKGLVKLHLRPKERVSEGRSGELVHEESSKVGGASEENVEQQSGDRRPPTVLEKGLIKLRLRPKERVSEGLSKDLVSEELGSDESYTYGGASEEHEEHSSEETRPPLTLMEKSLVKLHLRPKEDISEGRSKELVSEESSKDAGASEGNGKQHSEEPRPPTMLEKGLVKLHLRPKERMLEGRSRETLSEEGSKEGGASEENDEQRSKRRPPEVHILNETGSTVVLLGLPDPARAVILPVRLGLTVLEAESSIEYYDLMLLKKIRPKIPVNSECTQCKVVTVIAYQQRIYANGIRFDKGEHTINVAWTLPGDLTPSTQAYFGAITYDFRALVNTTRDEKLYSAWQSLLVKRYIRPHPRKSFNMVFSTPRSAVITVTTVPQTIYPTGEFPVHLRLTNIKTPERDISGKLCHWRWFLHKVSWSIIEQTTWVSDGCLNHTPRSNLFRRVRPFVDNEDFDMRNTYQDRREIGSGVFREGWMTDFACPGYGKIDFDFTVSINLGDAPVSSFRTWNEKYSVEHLLSIDMRLEDDMTGDLIGPVIPPQQLRVVSQLNIEEDSAKSVDWDEADPDFADGDVDGDSDEQSAVGPSVHSSITPGNDQGGKEEGEKEAGENEGGDSWFVPGKPDERGRPTYDFVGRGSRDQSLVGRQQVPQLELEEVAGSRGGCGGSGVDEEVFRPIIPDL